jgi:hypothetical protein
VSVRQVPRYSQAVCHAYRRAIEALRIFNVDNKWNMTSITIIAVAPRCFLTLMAEDGHQSYEEPLLCIDYQGSSRQAE